MLVSRRDMCPRDVVSSVGSLLLSTVIIGMFLEPSITLVLAKVLGSQTKRQLQERLVRLVIPSYVAEHEVVATEDVVADVVAELAFLMEEPLLLGFCVPLLLPLACVSMAANSVVFNLMISNRGVESNDYDSIRVVSTLRVERTLMPAAIMGYVLVVWFFFSCELHGRWLVVFGAPICALG